MKHEAQVVMLPTKDKTSVNLHLDTLHTKSIYRNNDIPFGTQLIPMSSEVSTPQHLYVTVSQEVEHIKEGDWFIVSKSTTIHNCIGFNNINDIESSNHLCYDSKASRKIIATTDKKLTQMRGSSSCTTNEGIEKFKLLKGVNYIPQQFINEYVDKGGIDTVMVEYQEVIRCYKCNKPEEACINTSPNCLGYFEGIDVLKLTTDTNIIIHSFEDKITEKHFRNFIRANHLTAQWDKWIKENL